MNCHSLLLIDDNPHDIELTLAALGDEPDQDVKVVTSGREALDYLASHPEKTPDLILLDLNMPHMNGLEVLDALRAQEQTRDVPVVVLTTAALVALLALDVSGVTRGEVERIWLPLAPWLMIATGGLPRRYLRLALAAQLTVALTVQGFVRLAW